LGNISEKRNLVKRKALRRTCKMVNQVGRKLKNKQTFLHHHIRGLTSLLVWQQNGR